MARLLKHGFKSDNPDPHDGAVSVAFPYRLYYTESVCNQ